MSKLPKQRYFAKVCLSEHRRQREYKEIMEPDETEESDNDKTINKITEIKHVIDRQNHYHDSKDRRIMKKTIIVHNGSPVTLIPPDKETTKCKETSPITE